MIGFCLTLLSLGMAAGTALKADQAAPARAPAPLDAATRQLSAAPLLSGKFVQEKTIAGLRKPLVSRGDFLVARDQGVIWRTQKPFLAAVSVTPKGIWALRETEGEIRRDPIHQGNLGVAMDMIQKVLAGDPASLKQAFAVLEKGEPGNWTIDLKPLDPVVARVITGIRLTGAKHVDRVEYAETNGDKTRIDFSAVADNPGALTAWRAIAFGE